MAGLHSGNPRISIWCRLSVKASAQTRSPKTYLEHFGQAHSLYPNWFSSYVSCRVAFQDADGFPRSFAPASSRLCSYRRFCGFCALSSNLFSPFSLRLISYTAFFALPFSLVSNFTLPHNKPKQQYIYGIKG